MKRPSTASRPRRLSLRAGLTLIELMIVVAIIGILSSIAVAYYGEYILDARISDARSIMQDISAKQMSAFASRGAFRSCPPNPTSIPSNERLVWNGSEPCWAELGVAASRPSYWRFTTRGVHDGAGADGITAHRAITIDSNWFYVVAESDLDGEGDSDFTQIIIDSESSLETIRNRGQ